MSSCGNTKEEVVIVVIWLNLFVFWFCGVCLCAFVFMGVCMRACVSYASVYVFVCVCLIVCVGVCVYVCIYAHSCVSISYAKSKHRFI